MTLKALIRLFKDLQIVAISGKNKKMNKKFQELIELTNSSDRVKLFEYTDKVPELMNISSAVVTKPGGLTITECLASNLPVIIINPIPGQEEENAEFLEQNNVGVWIKKGDSIARTLKNLSKHADNYSGMIESTKLLAKPNATEEICQILMNEIL
jgi:processive 1,2-diacylglycerol beta-glucosyltransferase